MHKTLLTKAPEQKFLPCKHANNFFGYTPLLENFPLVVILIAAMNNSP